MKSKIRPISYDRYRSALVRRLIPEVDRLFAENRKLGRALKVAVKKPTPIASATKAGVVYYPKRAPHPLAMLPRKFEFGELHLREKVADLLDFWYFDDETADKIRYIVESDSATELLNLVLSIAYDEGFIVQVRDATTKKSMQVNVQAANEIFRTKRRLILEFLDQRSDAQNFQIQIESWTMNPEGHLGSPENNVRTSRLWSGTLGALEKQSGARDLADILPSNTDDEVTFDIDWVFSWVNGEDPKWLELFRPWAPETITDAADRSRFETRDDLKYALRSLEQYAPWIRRIHVLTNCDAPEWLDLSDDRINWVDHSAVFEADALPTFSSHAIETTLHKIPGLSEHFVYSNDDFFLVRPAKKNDFFWPNGIARLRLEPYGMVNGPVTIGEPDYMNAARNCASLLHRDFGVSPVRLHTHSPQSMNRNVLAELEERYSEEFLATRLNKFRDSSDIAVTGFLYHHYAYITGRAVPDGGSTRLIQQNHRFEALFDGLVAEKRAGQKSKFLSVCVNDGRGSADNPRWGRAALKFVNTFFPSKSVFEK